MAIKKGGGRPPPDLPCVQLIGTSLFPRPEKTIRRSQPHSAPCQGAAAARTRCTKAPRKAVRFDPMLPAGLTRPSASAKRKLRQHQDEHRKPARKRQNAPLSKTRTRTDLRARRQKKQTVRNRKLPCLRESLIGNEVSRASTAASCTTLVGTSMDSDCSLGFISYLHKDNISKESLQVFFIKNEQVIIISYVN